MKVELDEVTQYLRAIGYYAAADRVYFAFIRQQPESANWTQAPEFKERDCGNRSCGAVACPTCGPIRQ